MAIEDITSSDTEELDEAVGSSGGTASTFSTSNSADLVLDAGFLFESITAPGPGYVLRINYSGTGPNGTTATQVRLNRPYSYRNLEVFLDDGRSVGHSTSGFERYDVTGSPGDDALYGGSGDDILRGGPGNDTLSGGDGRTLLDGDDGDDTFVTVLPSDSIDGGTGFNTIRNLSLSGITESVTLRLYGGDNLLMDDGTSIANVQNYESIFLGSGDDVIDGGAYFCRPGVGTAGIFGNAVNDLLRLDYSLTPPDGTTATQVRAGFTFQVRHRG